MMQTVVIIPGRGQGHTCQSYIVNTMATDDLVVQGIGNSIVDLVCIHCQNGSNHFIIFSKGYMNENKQIYIYIYYYYYYYFFFFFGGATLTIRDYPMITGYTCPDGDARRCTRFWYPGVWIVNTLGNVICWLVARQNSYDWGLIKYDMRYINEYV